jgi:NAD(P)H-flavin reductase
MCTAVRTRDGLVAEGAAEGTAAWIATEPWRVADARRETSDTVTLHLVPPGGYAFRPGQFNMLSVPGVGEVPISVSGDPAAGDTVLHTIRDVGAVTHALCALRPGERAGVRGPYGTWWPVEEAAGGDLVIVAGGIGLPPLRPALHEALADRDRFGRIVLLYGARTPDDLLFPGELAAWRARFDLDVDVTVDAAAPGWRGNVGVVPGLLDHAAFDPAKTTAFVVGPEIMMRFTVRALLAAGVAADRVYLSAERNMQCAVALCGHCQLGPLIVCRDGPVFRYTTVARWLGIREL